MKTIVDLREELIALFGQLKGGQVKPKEAKEMNNSAGKIINTLKVELEYSSLLGKKPNIDFLNVKKGTV